MRAFVVTILALAILLIAGVPMFLHPPTAYTGTRLHKTGALVQPQIIDVAKNSPAYRAGLRSGEVVGCLSEGADAIVFLGAFTGYVSGTPVDLCVKRGAAWQHVRFVPEPRPPAASIYHSDALAAVRLAGYAAFVLCALILLLGRPGLMTWMFFGYTITAAPNAAGDSLAAYLPPALFSAYSLISGIATLPTAAFLLAFTVLMPEDRAPAGWRRYALWVSWILAALLAIVGYFVYFQTAFFLSDKIAAWAEAAGSVLVVLAILGRLSTMTRTDRARFGWAAFAIGWTVIIDQLRLVAVLGYSTGSWVSLSAVITPVILLYAVLKRHVIDIRFAVSRTVVYAIITTIVIAIVGAVDWATSAYLHEVKVAMALDALVTIAVAFALNRIHRWVERVVDLALFRQKYAAEEYLNRLGRTLLDAHREETIHGELVRAPVKALDLTMAAVFRESESTFVICASAGRGENLPAGFDCDHELVRFLNSGRSRIRLGDIAYDSHAEIAIPIFQGKRLTGFALYGSHTDGTHLDPDEIETLEALREAASQAYISIIYDRYSAVTAEPLPAM